MKKYELLKKDRLELGCNTLYRIRALRSFGAIKAGELGGYVDSEKSLSHTGKAWIGGVAMVFNSSRVSGNALVDGHAQIFNGAQISENAHIGGWLQINDPHTHISGHSSITAPPPDPGPPNMR